MENNRLKDAAADGSMETVQLLLAGECCINQPDSRGVTPLITAARLGHGDVVEYLCKAGADVNQTSRNGESALYAACSVLYPPAVECLLKYGCDVNMKTNDLHPQTGRTSLMAALPSSYDTSIKGKKKSEALCIIKQLIEHGCDLNLRDWSGSTAIHMAAERGDVHTVCVLAENGADLRVRNNQNLNAFDYAIQPDKQRYDIAYVLLLYGHKIEDCQIVTHPLISLIKGIVHEEAKYFTSSRSNRKLLYEALIETVEWNEKLAESVEILLTNVPASEVEDLQYIRRFFTLRRPESLQCICRRLIRNAIKGNILQGIRKLCVAKAIKRFLALNFDIDFHNPVDILDLNLAIQEENIERVELLIKTDIDINFTFTNHTPLTESAKLGNLELFKCLLKEGAVIDLPDNTGFNSLHWAAALGHLHIIQECIFRGADANKLDEFQHENALTIAGKSGHFESLIYLLDHGAKPTVLTRNGIHALHFAAGSGNIGAVRGLLLKHVSPDTRDFQGNTPLHVAASRGLLYTSRNISLPALFPNEVAMNLDGIRNNMGLEPSMKYFKNSIEYENSVDHLGVIKLLMDAGADKLAINSISMTPLDVAMQYKFDNIIVFLR